MSQMNQTNWQGTYKGNPPPGAPDGGQWGSIKYGGDKTAILCIILCLLTGIYSGFGTCAYLCPQDEKDAYRVGNKVYDVSGRLIGLTKNVKFSPFPARK